MLRIESSVHKKRRRHASISELWSLKKSNSVFDDVRKWIEATSENTEKKYAGSYRENSRFSFWGRENQLAQSQTQPQKNGGGECRFVRTVSHRSRSLSAHLQNLATVSKSLRPMNAQERPQRAQKQHSTMAKETRAYTITFSETVWKPEYRLPTLR